MSGVADLFKFEPQAIVRLDWETYYDKKAKYSVKNMTVESYIRDPRFEAIGIGVKVDGGQTVWMEPADFARWAAQFDWSKVAVMAHQAQFDGLILSHHFGLFPGFFICTLSMAHALHPAVETGAGIKQLGPFYGLGEKGDEIEAADGKRRRDFTAEEWLRYGEYCRQDVNLMDGIFGRMIQNGFPEDELWLVDTTIKMFTNPRFVLDEPRMREYLKDEQERKAQLMRRVLGVGPEVSDAEVRARVRPILMSNPKLAQVFISMGVTPEKKISKKTGKEGWAFAKDDPGMQSLLEDEDEDTRLLAEARVAVKSTTNESRTERILKSGAGGRGVPIYLKYCLGGATPVLTHRGLVPIADVSRADLVWDGVEWVEHGGVVCQGDREVLAAHSIQATLDHRFLTAHGWRTWLELNESPPLLESALAVGMPPEPHVGRSRPRLGPSLGASSSGIGSCGGSRNAGWGGTHSSDVSVAGKESSIVETFGGPRNAPIVLGARGSPPGPRSKSTSGSSQTMPCGSERSLGSMGSSRDATPSGRKPTGIMEIGVSKFAQSGVTTGPISSGTSKHFPVGMTPDLILTELTTTEGMNQETSGSSRGQRTAKTNGRSQRCSSGFPFSRRKTAVYDLLSAGPRRRFTIWTDAGFLLAHNCAAHTFRWGGGDKMNAQNFEKTHKKNPKKGAIRKSLKAPEKKKVVVADSAQVEARGTGWVAGHKALLEVFADRKRSVYLEFGSEVYNRIITKADEQEYFVAKTATLGLGFQMGWPKFSITLLKGAMGGPPVRFKEADADQLGVDVMKFAADKKKVAKVRSLPTRLALEDMIVHSAVCEKIVYKYRDRNQPIVDLWKMMEVVIGCMVNGEEVPFGPGGVFKTVKDGIVMPNGLILQYPGLRRRNKGYSREQWAREQAELPVEDREEFDEEQSWGNGYSYMGGKGGRQRVKIYGGLATENLIQSMCRIIVGEQMLRIRAKYGWEPVLMAHDEIVLMVRDEEAEFAKAKCLEEMRIAPSWCPGIPLNAEAGIGQSYGEAGEAK